VKLKHETLDSFFPLIVWKLPYSSHLQQQHRSNCWSCDINFNIAAILNCVTFHKQTFNHCYTNMLNKTVLLKNAIALLKSLYFKLLSRILWSTRSAPTINKQQIIGWSHKLYTSCIYPEYCSTEHNSQELRQWGSKAKKYAYQPIIVPQSFESDLLTGNNQLNIGSLTWVQLECTSTLTSTSVIWRYTCI